MVNYKNTKIYSVRCRTDDTLIYFAFTTLDLDTSWERIIDLYKSGHKIGFYKLIENINDWYIQFELNYPCNRYSEANKGKQILIKKYKSLNYNNNDEYIKSLYQYKNTLKN